MTFTSKFNGYVCENDSIETEIDGVTYRARIERDTDYGIDDDDCHNPDQSVTGCNDEQFDKLCSTRRAWFNDEWFYCGVVISAHKAGICLDMYASALWGIEANYPDSDNAYLSEVANELLEEAINQAELTLVELTA